MEKAYRAFSELQYCAFAIPNGCKTYIRQCASTNDIINKYMKKHTFRFNKLVRDNIEQKLRDSDIEVKVAQLNTLQDIIHFFKAKLSEEELADLLEVIHSFIAHLKVPARSLEHIRLDKLESDGGFQNGTVVDTITIAEGNPALAYYLQNPVKYPQVNTDS